MIRVLLERPRPLIGMAVLVVIVAGGLAEALEWGTDLDDLLLGGRRFLAGEPLYFLSSASDGFIGPPFQALFMSPFALIARSHVRWAEVAWFGLCATGLIAGLVAWPRALGVKSVSSGVVALALAAVAFPAYREMQEQNLTFVFLGLFGLAALAAVRHRDAEAGAWIGVAAALKLYPGFALVYLLCLGRVRAAIAGVSVAAVLTLLPIARYGFGGFVDLWREWLRTRMTGVWVEEWINQSLPTRLSLALPESAAFVVWLACGALLAVPLWLAFRRRNTDSARVGDDLALALGVSVVASPIAWFSYWTLMFPGFLVAAREAVAGRRSAALVLGVGAALVSIVAPIRRESPGYEILFGGLLLILALTFWLWPARRTDVRSTP